MKIYGYILLNQEMHIIEARAQATYENTLDAKLRSVNEDLVYVPLNLAELVDELSKVEIYE